MTTYVPLKGFEDEYEIATEYPHHIRRIGDTEPISDRTRSSNGYVRVTLNRHSYQLHRLIANQFVTNDDPIHKTEVDHSNHIKDDNHISNLRWVTHSTNQRNKTGACNGVQYTYVEYEDEPDDLLVVTDYGDHQFEDYYYSPSLNLFYYDTGVHYKQLYVNIRKSTGAAFVCAYDTDDKRVKIYYTQFKRLNGLD